MLGGIWCSTQFGGLCSLLVQCDAHITNDLCLDHTNTPLQRGQRGLAELALSK